MESLCSSIGRCLRWVTYDYPIYVQLQSPFLTYATDRQILFPTWPHPHHWPPKDEPSSSPDVRKLKGTAAFAAWNNILISASVAFGRVSLIELYGIFVLFGDFFATIGSFAGNIPVVGPYIQLAFERASGGRRNAELPV